VFGLRKGYGHVPNPSSDQQGVEKTNPVQTAIIRSRDGEWEGSRRNSRCREGINFISQGPKER
jgi:hypothetical protein